MPVVAATARPTSPTTGTASGGTFRIARSPQVRESLWRYSGLLPAGARVEHGAGWTPLHRAERLSELLDLDLHLKLEGHNPTQSYKDRIATIAAATALDHGVTTLCCSSTGNLGHAVAAAAAATGLEAIVLAPVGGEAAASRRAILARASSRSPAPTTTAGGSSSSSGASFRGASSAGTSIPTRARAPRRSPSRSRNSSAGSCLMPSSAPRPAARSSRSSHRASPR